MGSVIKLSNKINNSYIELKKSVEDKLVMVDEKIEQKLQSNVDLVKKMSSYHLDTGGKKLRALNFFPPVSKWYDDIFLTKSTLL